MAMPSTLDPWREKGIPLEKQVRSWTPRVKAPYDKREVDAYTRTRVILMNGIENEAWNHAHHFARTTDDEEIRSLLDYVRGEGPERWRHRSRAAWAVSSGAASSGGHRHGPTAPVGPATRRPGWAPGW